MLRSSALRRLTATLLVLGSLTASTLGQEGGRTVWLSELDATSVIQGWGEPQADRSVEGKPMILGGRTFERGLGSHAPGVIRLELDGRVQGFHALVGVDDETEGRGSVVFRAFGDGSLLHDSGVLRGGDAPKSIDLDLGGLRVLVLVMADAGDGRDHDHADWAEARFTAGGADPTIVPAPREEPVLLTPPPPARPRINGPRILGVRPGSPFLYRIPATGERPLSFAARGLPAGLVLDPATGILTGAIENRVHRTHRVELSAENRHGGDRRELRIAVGETLALTPPMGWNSWYIHYNRITEADMRAAADVMIDSGMADFGYRYVNIDDCWMKRKGDEPYRDEDGALLPNSSFPDIRGMVDHIHARGLKAGLYTSPGPWTCAGYVGAHQHEEIDARQFAQWGFDFLKYDWCSYGGVAEGEGRDRLQRPYRLMSALLRQQDRDIVLNLCQYGMGNVWEWGGDVGGHCWRTTGDLGLERGDLLPGFFRIGLSNARHWEHARPGEWNDPDYILIGWVGSAHEMGEGLKTTLTPTEQYAYMSMWCLMAAPLIFSGDMARLDEFTLNVLCNHEVIEVDQDPLGQQAVIVRQTDEVLVLAKDMEDGSKAVGLFNLGELERNMALSWEEVGLDGPQRVRDLWRQEDLGRYEGSFETLVGRHGVAMLRLWPADE